jgi:hypothetical protein
MTTVAKMASDHGLEDWRWEVCVVIAAAILGIVAVSLLKSIPETSDSGINAPLVMLDLPDPLAYACQLLPCSKPIVAMTDRTQVPVR